MYVIYVQTALIQTDTNDTMYRRKTVKFSFWKKIFPGRYHIYHPNSWNVGVSTISRFCEIPPFQNEIPLIHRRDTTYPQARYHPTGHFCPKSPIFTPVSTGFSLIQFLIHFDTKYNSTNTSKTLGNILRTSSWTVSISGVSAKHRIFFVMAPKTKKIRQNTADSVQYSMLSVSYRTKLVYAFPKISVFSSVSTVEKTPKRGIGLWYNLIQFLRFGRHSQRCR